MLAFGICGHVIFYLSGRLLPLLSLRLTPAPRSRSPFWKLDRPDSIYSALNHRTVSSASAHKTWNAKSAANRLPFGFARLWFDKQFLAPNELDPHTERRNVLTSPRASRFSNRMRPPALSERPETARATNDFLLELIFSIFSCE